MSADPTADAPVPRHSILVEIDDTLLQRVRSFAADTGLGESSAVCSLLESALKNWPWTYPPKDGI